MVCFSPLLLRHHQYQPTSFLHLRIVVRLAVVVFFIDFSSHIFLFFWFWFAVCSFVINNASVIHILYVFFMLYRVVRSAEREANAKIKEQNEKEGWRKHAIKMCVCVFFYSRCVSLEMGIDSVEHLMMVFIKCSAAVAFNLYLILVSYFFFTFVKKKWVFFTEFRTANLIRWDHGLKLTAKNRPE